MEAPPSPLAPPTPPDTTPETPKRSRRHQPNPQEQALADKLACTAITLRDAADDNGLSIREAIELAAIQIGGAR